MGYLQQRCMQLVQASLCGPEQQRIEGKHQHTREWQPRRTPIRTFNRNTEVKFVWWKIVFFHRNLQNSG
jgi:hypothetical protein